MIRRLAVVLAVGALLVATAASADQKPPPNSKPLSQVAAAVERAGYSPIVEADFDNGSWEIEAYQGETKYELRVDPMSGEIKSKRVDS
jgi:hypothetical protein